MTTARPRLRVCYIFCYRDVHYPRARAQIEILRHSDEIDLLVADHHSGGALRYVQTLRALLAARRQRPDVYVLGFRGHEIAWLVRWLTRDHPLVFDALMSPWAALAEENKAGFLGQLVAPLVRQVEARALHAAQLVLTDTPAHAAFYRQAFAVPAQKLLCLPVAAIESYASTRAPPRQSGGTFKVLFYGSFLPLHGVDIILRAAAAVRDLPLQFDFIGGSRRWRRALRQRCRQLGIERCTHRTWVPLNELLELELPSASLVLGGPFGNTPQAARVITTKTCQSLAAARPTVIGQIDDNPGFCDRVNCLLVPRGDVQALADALRWAYAARDQLEAIGRAGRELYATSLSSAVVERRLVPALLSLRPGEHRQSR